VIRPVRIQQRSLRSVVRMTRVGLAFGLAGLVAAAVAGARSSQIAGHVTGLPRSPLLSTVLALDTQGVIAQIAPPSPAGSYRFFLSPGTYIVAAGAASAASPGARKAHLFLSISAPIRVLAGKQSQARIHLKRVHSTRASAAARIPLKDAVVTVGNIPILDDRAAPTLVGGTVGFHTATMLYNLCSRVGTRFVETSPAIVAKEKQELALSRAGMLSTPFDYRPLKPEFAITGSVTIVPETEAGAPPNTQRVTVELIATRLGGGGVVVDTKFIAPQTRVDDPLVLQHIVDGGVEKFAGAACGRSTLF
jgi:hypothetical protein